MESPQATLTHETVQVDQSPRPFFWCKVSQDNDQWFELEGVPRARWFCKNHNLHQGDHVKVIIVKVRSNVRADSDNQAQA